MESAGYLVGHPETAKERTSERSTDTQQPALRQAQSTKFPGEMGEERRIYVVDEIKEVNTMPCSPEVAAVLIPQSPPSPRRLDDESVLKTASQQHDHDVNEEQMKVNKCLPEDGTAPALPITAPLPSTRNSAPRQSSDELGPPSKAALRMAPSKEGEGGQLERAVAYIHERMNRRTLSCDVFVPRARKDPPDKPAELDARQNGQETVSVNTTSVALHSPDNLVTFMLLVPESDLSLPSTSVSPASPNNDLISKEDQLIVTQTRYNNETYKIEIETHECRRVSDDVNGGNEASRTRLHKVENEDVKPRSFVRGTCHPSARSHGYKPSHREDSGR